MGIAYSWFSCIDGFHRSSTPSRSSAPRPSSAGIGQASAGTGVGNPAVCTESSVLIDYVWAAVLSDFLRRMSGSSSFFLVLVRWQRREPFVLDGATYREVVEALPVARRDAEHLVNGIIEVATDPGRTNARRFSFEVQHLAYETGLPEEISIERGAVGNQAVHVVGDHP